MWHFGWFHFGKGKGNFIPPEMQSLKREQTSYGRIAHYFGIISFLLGIVLAAGHVAEASLKTLEIQVGSTVIRANNISDLIVLLTFLSVSVAAGSAFHYFKHIANEINEHLDTLDKRANLDKLLIFDLQRDQIRSVAAKRASAEVLPFLNAIQLSISQIELEQGAPVTKLKDWSLVGAFIRQLVNTLAERDQTCIWMGVSLVTHQEGWSALNDVVYQFESTMRHAISRKVVDKMYRLYFIENGTENAGARIDSIRSGIEDCYGQLSPEGSSFKVIQGDPRLDVRDISLVWVNDRYGRVPPRNLPDPSKSIEELHSGGWRLVLALEWNIRSNFFVDSIEVHSAEDSWVDENYRRLRRLWREAGSLQDSSTRVPIAPPAGSAET